MQPDKKIVLIIPAQLLDLADSAAQTLQISRLAFIRQAIMARLIDYRDREKQNLEALLMDEICLTSDLISKK